MRISVLNGPNLNLLGVREPEVYGTVTLAEIERRMRDVASELRVELRFAQYNGEGELVSAIQGELGRGDGIVINAAAYTHGSLAVVDALNAVALPYVEVHLSNIFGREPERRHSLLAPRAVGFICGFGAYGYELALHALVRTLRNRG